MRCAIPNGGPLEGVRLLTNQSSPLPDGAIAPIPNWDAIKDVPEKYLVAEGDEVREMTANEKKAVDNAMIADIKHAKCMAIDMRSCELIDQGFVHNGKLFSLSAAAQRNWMALMDTHNAGLLTFPLAVSVKADDEEYVIQDAAEFLAFWGAAMGTGKAHIDAGRALKLAVAAASDIDALNTVVDER